MIEFIIEAIKLIEQQRTADQAEVIAQRIIEIILESNSNLVGVLQLTESQSFGFADLIDAIGHVLSFEDISFNEIKEYLMGLTSGRLGRVVAMAAEGALDLLEFKAE